MVNIKKKPKKKRVVKSDVLDYLKRKREEEYLSYLPPDKRKEKK